VPLRLIAALFAVAALLACAGATPPPSVRLPPEGSYPFRTANFDSAISWGGEERVRMRTWVAPAGILEESTRDGKVSFVLQRGAEIFAWDLGARGGLRGPRGRGASLSGAPDTLDVLRELPLDLDPKNSRFAGFQRLGGYRVGRYDFRWRHPVNRMWIEGTVWILENRPFPVRYVHRGFGGTYEIRNSGLKFDLEIPPGFLAPPEDVSFRRLPAMAAPRAPGRE
jgi:hypothetical protein